MSPFFPMRSIVRPHAECARVPTPLIATPLHGLWLSLSAINNRIPRAISARLWGKGRGQSHITSFAPLANNGYFTSCANLTSLPRLLSMPAAASSSHFPVKGKRPVRGQGTASIPSPFPRLGSCSSVRGRLHPGAGWMAWATRRTPSAAHTRLTVSSRGFLSGRKALYRA